MVDVSSLGILRARHTLCLRTIYILKTPEKRELPGRNFLSASVSGCLSIKKQSRQDCAIAGAFAAFLIKDAGFHCIRKHISLLYTFSWGPKSERKIMRNNYLHLVLLICHSIFSICTFSIAPSNYSLQASYSNIFF